MPTLILAVDTQVVMFGHKMSSSKEDPPLCYSELLSSFFSETVLALDKHTRQEYEDNMGEGSPGRDWLAHLAEMDRIQFFEKVPRERPKTKAVLIEVGFNKKDWKFVRLALAMDEKYLIAEEKHFVNVAGMLKKHEHILVVCAQEACQYICANRQADCAVATPSEPPPV